MPHANPDTTPAIASLGARTPSSAAPLPHANPATVSPNSPCNGQQTTSNKPPTTNNEPSPIPQSTIRNPQSLDLSHPAGLERLHLIAALTETKAIRAFESMDALSPADQLFHDRLSGATQAAWRATAMRKTLILLDDHFEAINLNRQAREAAQAQSEAEQAQLAARREAEEKAQAELHLKAIDRAEELITRLAAEDANIRQVLTETGADLAAEFERLRHPQPEAPAGPDQRRIDSAARDILFGLLYGIERAHPRARLRADEIAWEAENLARTERGEPDPDDDDDIYNDVPWEDDDFTGSADVPSASAPADDAAIDINESPGARASSPAIASANQSVSGIHEGASSLGPRTSSPAIASARPLAPLSPFTPQLAAPNTPQSTSNEQQATHDERQATHDEQQATHNEQQPTTNNNPFPNPQSEIHNPQSPIIRNCAVPVCPTLSPRRLQAILASAPAGDLSDSSAPIPASDPIPESDSQPAPASNAADTPQATPASPTGDVGHLTSINSSHPFAHVLRRARARPGF